MHIGFSVYGQPKYKDNFSHFDYVSPLAKKAGDVRLCALGRVGSFNPYSYRLWPAEGLKKTFSTLLARSEDEIASAYGYLASGIEFSKDGKSFTFYIRPSAVFHDGSPVTPEDIIATFKAINHPFMPQHSGILSGIDGVEKVSDYGVKFTVAKGNIREKAFLLGTEMFILSKTDLEKHPLVSSSKHIYLGSGPYKLVPSKSTMRIQYKRIPNWWGEHLPVNKYKYNFNTISYNFFYTQQGSFEALKARQLDVREENVAEQWKRGYDFPAIQRSEIEKLEFPHSSVSGMMGIVFNLQNPFFQDVNVRKAIALMLDFAWMNKNIFSNSYKRLKSFFTGTYFEAKYPPSEEELQNLKAYTNSLPKDLFKKPFSPAVGEGEAALRPKIEKALKLLKLSGWEMRNGQLINKKTGRLFKINILLPTVSYTRFMHGFQKNLQRIGITASLETPDKATYKHRKNTQDFDMLAGAFYPVFEIPGSKLELYWHSKHANKKGTKNLTGVSSPIVDFFLEKIKTAKTEKELVFAMRSLDRILLYNYYLIPQWTSTNYRIAKSKLIEKPNKKLYHGFGFDTWWFKDKLSLVKK